MSVTERFWAKVDRNGPLPAHRPDLGPCWLWTAGHNGQGYGQLRMPGHQNIYAHRLSHEMHSGPIPDGYEVDHLCRVTQCVNPLHLEAVTPKENTHRSRALESLMERHAARTHCKHGHPLAGENIRMWRGRRLCRTCARARVSGRDPKLEPVEKVVRPRGRAARKANA